MYATHKVALLAVLLTLTGYSFPAFSETEDTLASIRKAGEVKVAVASMPPYMTISSNGEPTGVLIDLQNMVLKRLGLPGLTPAVTQWDSMIPGLQAQQFNYVSVLAITEQRCKALIFAAPYFAAQLGLYVPPGNPKHLTGAADIARRPDLKVAMITSVAWMPYALKQGIRSEQIVRVPDVQAGVATVIGGRADAYLEAQFVIPNPEQKGIDFVLDEQSPAHASGAVFRKEDIRFRNAFSEQLRLLIQNGAIQELYKKYGLAGGEVEAKLLAKMTKASDAEPSCE